MTEGDLPGGHGDVNAPHRFSVRVYYEDTDFSGIVYHAAYLHFFERARTEFLRSLGVHHSELIRDGIAFAVRSMAIEFEAAARIDDLLEVETRVASLTPARIVGQDHDLGSLAPGKRADVVVLDKDLQVQRVFIDGKEFLR